MIRSKVWRHGHHADRHSSRAALAKAADVMQYCQTKLKPGTECLAPFARAQASVHTLFSNASVEQWIDRNTCVADLSCFLAVSGYFCVAEIAVGPVVSRLGQYLMNSTPGSDDGHRHVDMRCLMNVIHGATRWGYPHTQDHRLIIAALHAAQAVVKKQGELKHNLVMDVLAVGAAVGYAYQSVVVPPEVDELLANLIRLALLLVEPFVDSVSLSAGPAPVLWHMIASLSISSDLTLTPFEAADYMARTWPCTTAATIDLATRLAVATLTLAFANRRAPTEGETVDGESALQTSLRILFWVLATPLVTASAARDAASAIWGASTGLDLHEAIQGAELALDAATHRAHIAGDDATVTLLRVMIVACIDRGGALICRSVARSSSREPALDLVRFSKRWLLALTRCFDVPVTCDRTMLSGPLNRCVKRAVAVTCSRVEFAGPLRSALETYSSSPGAVSEVATDLIAEMERLGASYVRR